MRSCSSSQRAARSRASRSSPNSSISPLRSDALALETSERSSSKSEKIRALRASELLAEEEARELLRESFRLGGEVARAEAGNYPILEGLRDETP